MGDVGKESRYSSSQGGINMFGGRSVAFRVSGRLEMWLGGGSILQERVWAEGLRL